MTAPSRMLALLSLLQTRRDWPGQVLADRLTVTPRTIRRDVDRLRSLGYRHRIDAVRFIGTGGDARVDPQVLEVASHAVRTRRTLRFGYGDSDAPRSAGAGAGRPHAPSATGPGS